MQEQKEYVSSTSIRFSEHQGEHFGSWMDVSNILYTGKSQFQDIKILETPTFGAMLVLDGKVQSSTKDEFIYHESLVHPSMIFSYNENNNKPKSIFIGGGGEFCTVREILKYNDKYVNKVVMCDIDKQVCDNARIYYKNVLDNGKIFNDKRLKIIYDDATKILFENKNEKYDIIIMDIADPIECGPGIKCYFKQFYQECFDKLTENGIFITQSGATDLCSLEECFPIIQNTMKSVFGKNNVIGYSCYVPSFYCDWGFNIGFKGGKPKWINDCDKIDELLNKLMKKGKVDTLRFFDGHVWLRISNLPKFVKKCCNEEKRVATKENPCYSIYGNS